MINKANDQNTSTPTLEEAQSKNTRFPKNWPLVQIGLIFLPVILIAFALYTFMSSPLRLVQPEKTNETPASQQIGQRFLAENAGLRSVSVWLAPARELGSGLQLHLREPGATADLRSSRATERAKDDWVRFDFAPLEASFKGKPLFFWIEAQNRPLELFWYEGEVYRDGESYLDGVAQPGDLSFQLEYNPDPAAFLDTFFKRQAAYNAPTWLGLIMLALWGGLALVGCAVIVMRRKTFSSGHIRQMKAGEFWPVAGYFLVLMACGSITFMCLTPPLQGLDEQGHLGRIMYVYQYQSSPTAFDQLYQAEYDLENRARYIEYIPGFGYERSPLDSAIVPPLSERYQPPVYYAITGGIVRLGAWLSGDQSLLMAQYMARLASVLFGLGGLAIALGWVYYLRREAPWLLLAVPAAFALSPTYLFISGMVNNDNAVNFFAPLVILCLTVLYKEGYESGYRRTFWKRWWPVAAIGLGSSALALTSKQTSAAFLGGLAIGLLIYICTWLKRPVRRNLLLAVATLVVLGGLIIWLKPPVQMEYFDIFVEGLPGKSRVLVIIQVLILTFESFWCSAGWVNFSEVAEGRVMLGIFLLFLVAIWGIARTVRCLLRTRGKTTPLYNGKPRWAVHLALTLGLAVLIHFLFLVIFRIFTTYPRSPEVIEFPQGRFFLLGLVALSALLFSGLRAALPTRLRQQAALWSGFYLWFLGLLVYSLIMIFGGLLPYYYNLY